MVFSGMPPEQAVWTPNPNGKELSMGQHTTKCGTSPGTCPSTVSSVDVTYPHPYSQVGDLHPHPQVDDVSPSLSPGG